ncbi:MAG TPA: O-antigen ligase family protein [Acidobacteriota bacterium]
MTSPASSALPLPRLNRRPAAAPAALRRPRSGLFASDLTVLAFLLLHIPLALLLHGRPFLATAHAYGTIALGISFLSRDRHPFRLLYVIAYITGAELLWRATDSFTFYEFGKYATAVLLISAILKYNLLKTIDVRGLLYFVLLLPSLVQLPDFDRESIAFNLSGPFALSVAVMFFGALRLPRAEIPRICLVILAPILALVTLSTFTTLTYMPGVFIVGSKLTSGGVGPNQMSSMLGLGVFLAFLLMFIRRNGLVLRMTLFGCLLWFAGQCTMTFSRGGFWTSLIAISIASFYLLTGRRRRAALLVLVVTVFLLFNFVIFPALDDYTGGLLGERFRDFDPTGRDEILQVDMLAFKQNPVLGVGPGASKTLHLEMSFGAASAHTEFSRLLAEHGSLGLIASLLLLSLIWQRFRDSWSRPEMAGSIAFVAWALLFMSHAAMRLVAPCFLFGLGSGELMPEGDSADPRRRRLRPVRRQRPRPPLRRVR